MEKRGVGKLKSDSEEYRNGQGEFVMVQPLRWCANHGATAYKADSGEYCVSCGEPVEMKVLPEVDRNTVDPEALGVKVQHPAEEDMEEEEDIEVPVLTMCPKCATIDNQFESLGGSCDNCGYEWDLEPEMMESNDCPAHGEYLRRGAEPGEVYCGHCGGTIPEIPDIPGPGTACIDCALVAEGCDGSIRKNYHCPRHERKAPPDHGEKYLIAESGTVGDRVSK